MSFLSLAKGDPAARALLQRAIRARYGMRPLQIESVHLELTGQGTGPVGLPVKILVSARFVTASHWRWDATRKLFGIPIGKSSTSFDSGAVYQRTGNTLSQSSDVLAIQGARRRLWSEVSVLLTPLTMPDIILKTVDESTFQAMPENEPDDVVTVRLNADDTVASVKAQCYRMDKQQELTLTIKPEGGLQTLNGFTLPKDIVYQWDSETPERYTVIKAEANPRIPLTEFTMS